VLNKLDITYKIVILGLLIYMAISVKELQDEVFRDPNIMIPMFMKPL
tara:strand:- start:405 stop:545 length:141 start_codon:yes stop_codon:yes gene_type:complete